MVQGWLLNNAKEGGGIGHPTHSPSWTKDQLPMGGRKGVGAHLDRTTDMRVEDPITDFQIPLQAKETVVEKV